MRGFRTGMIGLSIAGSLFAAFPAAARVLNYRAALGGGAAPTDTGSDATGNARIRVDTNRKLVSVDLTITGITLEGLSPVLKARPIGPIHFHKYGSHDHAGDDVVLVLPLPFGSDYHATAHGLHVTMKNYDYAAGAKLLGSDASLDDFVAALDQGQVILNVHTGKFPNGEISGTVVSG